MLDSLAGLPAPLAWTMVLSISIQQMAEQHPSRTTVSVPRAYLSHSRQANVSFERLGKIRKVLVKEGQFVTEGDVLAELEQGVPRAALALAEADAASDVVVRAARIAVKSAELEYRLAIRANERQSNTVPLAEIERLRLTLIGARRQVETREHDRSMALLRKDIALAELNQCTLRAPFSGTVRQILRHPGEVVQADNVVLELTDTTSLRAEGYAPLSALEYIRVGDPVIVRAEDEAGEVLPNEPACDGTLVFVDTAVEPVRRVVRIVVELPRLAEHLKAGLSVRLDFAPVSQSAASE